MSVASGVRPLTFSISLVNSAYSLRPSWTPTFAVSTDCWLKTLNFSRSSGLAFWYRRIRAKSTPMLDAWAGVIVSPLSRAAKASSSLCLKPITPASVCSAKIAGRLASPLAPAFIPVIASSPAANSWSRAVRTRGGAVTVAVGSTADGVGPKNPANSSATGASSTGAESNFPVKDTNWTSLLSASSNSPVKGTNWEDCFSGGSNSPVKGTNAILNSLLLDHSCTIGQFINRLTILSAN